MASGPEALMSALRKLAPQAARALGLAENASREWRHGFLGIEHLLWALTQLPELSHKIKAAGQDAATLQRAAMVLLSQNDFQLEWDPNSEQVACTPRVFRLLTERAPFVAQRRGHIWIEPEDLLLAVLQEEGTPLMHTLNELGVNVPELLVKLEKRPRPRLDIPDPLSRWCWDLTAQAERGELPPLVDREKELERIIRILLIPQDLGPANPLLIGEAGVGKTALVHGLAQHIAAGKELKLSEVRIVQVNMNAMQAGTWLRGSFEENLQKTIDFARGRPGGVRIVLFIDEMHLIIGAGRAMGVPADAAQILLEPLSQGQLRIIGATTIEQYQQQIAQDDALSRRFSVVDVGEPSLKETCEIVRGVRSFLEQRFQQEGTAVRFSDGAIEKALELSSQYLHSQRLPHKPRQLLIDAATRALREGRHEVLAQDVAHVVAEVTGIPPDIIFRNARGRVRDMEQVLRARVRGQDQAIETLARRLRLNMGPLRENVRKPLGVFLFVGPTGVGKTELAKALAEYLFGYEDRMIRLDMTAFKTEADVWRLIGPPPGVVRAGRGELTDKIRYQSYTVVLLDEFEKAHDSVRALFFPVFDEGWLTDGLGHKVYFSDAIIILTSNLGSDEYQRLLRRIGFELGNRAVPSPEDVQRAYLKAVEEHLSPELLNRIDAICVFNPLSPDTVVEIAELLFTKEARRFGELGKELIYTNEAVRFIAEMGFDAKYNARGLKRAFVDFVARELDPRLHEGDRFRVEVVPGCGEGATPRLNVAVERSPHGASPMGHED